MFDDLMVFLKEFSEKVNVEKNQQTTEKACKITQHAKTSTYLVAKDVGSIGHIRIHD